MLDTLVAGKQLTANAVYGFFPANSVGDDIILYTDESRSAELTRFHTLRQQWQRQGQSVFRSLADYIAPLDSGRLDYLGAFAVTAGIGIDPIVQKFEKDHDDYNSIMVKSLADRLAEAFAEALHQQARRDWGYGAGESLSNDQLIDENYRGIRPAPGYPACPDHTEKQTLWKLLDVEAAHRHPPHRDPAPCGPPPPSAASTSPTPNPATSPSTSSPATRSTTTPRART